MIKKREEQPGGAVAGAKAALPEVWAGVESTVNRVGNEYFEQLTRSGHDRRLDDLDRFAGLGIKALRYPVLWERTQPDPKKEPDWNWADERLGRLRELSIRPIVGLVHHGSGPRHTSLVDPAFPEGLAYYARRVAERFPWIEDYTPVNEPLTTARFSGLYGHWYPHGRDEAAFARALLTQCKATVLAMRAIRQVNPVARLVQTEDMGKTYGTGPLMYQVEFDNIRRWVSFDLLCGRVDPGHRMWGHFLWAGIPEEELRWFLENPCPPDMLGINHYLTSERFLDHRLDRYPGVEAGSNGRDSYVDVEAVRVCSPSIGGPQALLQEVWDRYGLPVAVTEVHLGCTREEQMRWLLEVWSAACILRERQVDIRAVTAWSLLGAFDWDSLLTRNAGSYEPGVFDVRGPHPRPTALAGMLKQMAAGKTPEHPVLVAAGWWRRPKRLLYPPTRLTRESGLYQCKTRVAVARQPSPLLITGATGTLGRAFARLCDHRGIAHRLVGRHEMDIADSHAVASALNEIRPWAVINTAGFVRVDEAEQHTDRCFRENTDGPVNLAQECAARDLPLVSFSSDLVFNGKKLTPYIESDPVSPLNIYGQSKAAAEQSVLHLHPGALLIRTSAFFGPWDEYNFITQALRTLASGKPFRAANDAVISPTYVPDLVHACLDLLLDREMGIWHLANPGAVTWYELARMAARMAGIGTAGLEAAATYELGFDAERPLFSVLGSQRGVLLSPLERALECYLRDCEVSWQRRSDAVEGATPHSLSRSGRS